MNARKLAMTRIPSKTEFRPQESTMQTYVILRRNGWATAQDPDEIIAVADTVVIRPDPEPVST